MKFVPEKIRVYTQKMKTNLFYRILFGFSLSLIFVTQPLCAQAQMSFSPSLVSGNANVVAGKDVQTTAKSMPIEADEEVTVLRDDYAGKYNPSTLENLSRLYWHLGAFDFDDETAIGNFLKINDCKIYTDYLNDDLEWKKIVSTMKEHLKLESTTFPLNYQFILSLHLGRYDIERGGFPIVDKTGFDQSQRIEVDSIDRNRQICFDYSAIKDYPKSVMILLNKPFNLTFLKVNEHVAQAYILRKKEEYKNLKEGDRIKAYERDAYLRLRVTFSQYHGNLRGENGNTMAILYGNIDGYEIFEDSAQERLMFSENFLASNEQDLQPQISTPVDVNDDPEPNIGMDSSRGKQ